MTDLDLTEVVYRLAIFSPVDEPERLSETFQTVLGMHPTDAKIWARHLPGVLHETFTLQDAQALATAIAELGLRVRVIRRDDVPNLHSAERVHHLRCDESGLQLMDVEGHPALQIPWDSIEMICIGEAPLDTTRHYAGERWDGIAGGRRSPHQPVETTRSTGLEAWITCRSPYPSLRIDHEQMNYEYLGDRCVESATVNFRSLIGDLAERSKNAMLTESTHAYLRHVQPEHYRFKTETELLHYATIQALLARELVAAMEAPASDSVVPEDAPVLRTEKSMQIGTDSMQV